MAVCGIVKATATDLIDSMQHRDPVIFVESQSLRTPVKRFNNQNRKLYKTLKAQKRITT